MAERARRGKEHLSRFMPSNSRFYPTLHGINAGQLVYNFLGGMKHQENIWHNALIRTALHTPVRVVQRLTGESR